jgi:hypothetical protein
MSLQAVLERLHAYKVRPTGQGRYRAICPVCGERNASTLSIGETPQGAVLVKCFKLDCDVDSICGALGLEVSDLFPPRESFGTPLARRRLLSDRQALDLAHDEVHLVALLAASIAQGVQATAEDCQRALQAAGRLAYLCEEARS